jgi:hypothetical protein
MTLMIIFASAGGTTLPGWPVEVMPEQGSWPLSVPLILLIAIGAVLSVVLRRKK